MVQVQENKDGNAVVAGGAGAIAGAGTFMAASNALGKKVADVVQAVGDVALQTANNVVPSVMPDITNSQFAQGVQNEIRNKATLVMDTIPEVNQMFAAVQQDVAKVVTNRSAPQAVVDATQTVTNNIPNVTATAQAVQGNGQNIFSRAGDAVKGMGGNIRDVAANSVVAFKGAGLPKQIVIVGLTAAAAAVVTKVIYNVTRPKDTITAPAEHQGVAVGLEHGKTR